MFLLAKSRPVHLASGNAHDPHGYRLFHNYVSPGRRRRQFALDQENKLEVHVPLEDSPATERLTTEVNLYIVEILTIFRYKDLGNRRFLVIY